MKVRVVCVSRTFGSVGVALAQVLAEKLGFRYVDEEVIERAAAKAKLSPEELAATERKPSVMKRLLESIGVAGMDMVRKTMDFDYYDLRGKEPEPAPDDHRALIRQAIHEIAEEGGAVIVAHAASMALAARTDVLRVLVTASPEVRAKRVEDLQGGDGRAQIARDDDGRADYLKRFYGVDRELPTHYDLVINTDKLDAERAIAALVAAAQA